MPTPFYHLSIAVELFEQASLSEERRAFLNAYRCEFLFGNTAPDVQVFSGQAREETHFFDLPIRKNDGVPWQRILRVYPALAKPSSLSPRQTAFLLGYLCHLQADWFWVRDIFSPVFGFNNHWGNREQRLYLHNVLRAYLDLRILENLSECAGLCLKNVHPQNWMPFIRDDHLCAWRDYLSLQLEPGAAIRTVEVFASRQGIDPTDFYQMIESEADMEREVFAHVPRQQMEFYRRHVVQEHTCLIKKYMECQFGGTSSLFAVEARLT